MNDWVLTWKPTYPPDLHSDVVGECRDCWAKCLPWTPIRELRKGVDDSKGAVCVGSQGKFHLECRERVEGVQYTTAFGTPAFFCEKHALEQDAWDKILYHSKPTPKHIITPEWEAEVARLMVKIEKKKRKKEEPEEADPTA